MLAMAMMIISWRCDDMTTQMEGMMENMTSGLEGDLDQMMAALEEAVANNQVLMMIFIVSHQIPTSICG